MALRQIIGLAAFSAAAAVSQAAVGQRRPEIRVLVYEYTGKTVVPVRALAESARVLHKAGISIRWIPCPASSEDAPRFPDCRVEGANTVVLRFIKSPGPGTTLGATMGTMYVTVYRDRTRAAAMTARCSEDIVLGYAVAHELGHVLLGTSAHRKEGPMKAWWTASDLKLAEARLLWFGPDECARMRAEVIRRNSVLTAIGPGVDAAAGGSGRE